MLAPKKRVGCGAVSVPALPDTMGLFDCFKPHTCVNERRGRANKEGGRKAHNGTRRPLGSSAPPPRPPDTHILPHTHAHSIKTTYILPPRAMDNPFAVQEAAPPTSTTTRVAPHAGANARGTWSEDEQQLWAHHVGKPGRRGKR